MNLFDQYSIVRKRTESICSPLAIEDFVVQPADFVSPLKWHLGHTSWFFEKVILSQFLGNYTPYHPQFDFVFNSYYQSFGNRTLRPERGFLSRPTVKEVLEYRKYVDERMNELFFSFPSAAASLLSLGIQHEQQHQELLLTDIKYILGMNPLHPVYDKDSGFEIKRNSGPPQMIHIDAGMYTIGHCTDDFCFDNEKPPYQVYLEGFSISDSLVTNREYLGFIEEGGYRNFRYWLDDGWTWINENNIRHPLYWEDTGEGWMSFSLSGKKPLDPDDAVCHVSYYEASAFAQYKNKRLPTEQEWEIAARKFEWGSRWEWTSSAYLPYPHFRPLPGPTGEYNGKFMINQMVLRGASVATPPDHRRITYRNFFHPETQWQYSGIRLAE